MKLYFARGTCALAPHLALVEAGADFEPVEIDFASNQQLSPDYLKINPKGRVPALVTDRGILTETPAILLFVAQSFPHAGLAPLHDPFALAQVHAFTSFLCSTVHVNHAHGARGTRWVDANDKPSLEAMLQKVPETMAASFQVIEDTLLQGPWVMGEHYTLCDPYLFTLTRWLERDRVDVRRYAKVSAHFDAMHARAAVKAVLPLHQK